MMYIGTSKTDWKGYIFVGPSVRPNIGPGVVREVGRRGKFQTRSKIGKSNFRPNETIQSHSVESSTRCTRSKFSTQGYPSKWDDELNDTFRPSETILFDLVKQVRPTRSKFDLVGFDLLGFDLVGFDLMISDLMSFDLINFDLVGCTR